MIAIGRAGFICRTTRRVSEIQLGFTRLAEFCSCAVRLLTARALHERVLQESGRQSLLLEKVIQLTH